MAPQSYIRVRSPDGTLRTTFTAAGRDGGENGFLYLAWHKIVNGVHYGEFQVARSNPDVQYLIDKNIVEFWRYDRTIGLAEYVNFTGEIRDDQLEADEYNQEYMTVKAYGPNSRLARRIVAYPADESGYTAFGAINAETLMKTLVGQNAGPSVNSSLRDRNPSTLGITLEADGARGAALTGWNVSRKNLLTALQDIQPVAGGDFDLVALGSGAYQFRFYPGQLGTDRTTGANKVIFSPTRGNMKTPKLIRERSSESTVAIVGGQGEKRLRIIRVRTGPNYSTTNDIEAFYDGRNDDSGGALDAIGDANLAAAKFRNVLEYEVIQTHLYSIDKDYFLGDLVLAQAFGLTITQQVAEVTGSYKDGKEQIDIVMKDR